MRNKNVIEIGKVFVRNEYAVRYKVFVCVSIKFNEHLCVSSRPPFIYNLMQAKYFVRIAFLLFLCQDVYIMMGGKLYLKTDKINIYIPLPPNLRTWVLAFIKDVRPKLIIPN